MENTILIPWNTPVQPYIDVGFREYGMAVYKKGVPYRKMKLVFIEGAVDITQENINDYYNYTGEVV